MKKIIIFTFILLAIGISNESRAQIRTEQPPDKIIPQTPFDEAAAKQSLAEGTSMIQGVACSITEGRVYMAENTTVTLYPDTPHLREWIKLGNDKGFAVVRMSPAATKYRIEATTDEGGRFQFTKIKPGKYFLLSYYKLDLTDGEENWTVGRSLERFVEIKNDGETIKIHLASDGRRNSILGPKNDNCNSRGRKFF